MNVVLLDSASSTKPAVLSHSRHSPRFSARTSGGPEKVANVLRFWSTVFQALLLQSRHSSEFRAVTDILPVAEKLLRKLTRLLDALLVQNAQLFEFSAVTRSPMPLGDVLTMLNSAETTL